MAECVFFLGETGTGKSTAIRTLDPKDCAIINIMDKSLPFRGAEAYNVIATDSYPHIIETLRQLDADHPKRFIIILDDFQYLMANMWMRSLLEPKTKDSEFQKYKEIGYVAWDIIMQAKTLNKNKIVFFLSHTDIDEHGKTRAKTVGRLLNEKVTLEGMFTTVLETVIHPDKPLEERYKVRTQSNGTNTAKSPMGMFAEDEIPNDLKLVANAIINYRKPVVVE
jgi:hypothetical protein